MNLRHINSFLVLSEKLNFTKASAELYVAQPSLSRNIVLLEEEIGGRLFHRSKHSVSLTALGKAFLPYAQNIKKAYDEAEAFAVKTKKDLKKIRYEVRLGIGIYQFVNFLPSFISEISQAMPNLYFSVVDGLQEDIIGKLRLEELDFIFIPEHSLIKSPDFETLHIFSAPLKLVISNKHPLAERMGPVSVEEINACGLPIFTLEPTMRPYLENAFPNLEIKQLNSIVYSLPLVEAGMGIAIFPEKIQKMTNNAVRFIDIADYPMKLNMVAAWKKKTSALPWWHDFIIATTNYIESYPFDSDTEQKDFFTEESV